MYDGRIAYCIAILYLELHGAFFYSLQKVRMVSACLQTLALN